MAIFTVVLCLTVATVMVGLRIYTRKFITKQMGMDDWAAIITLVSLASHTSIGAAEDPRIERRALTRLQIVTYADGITIATGRGRILF